MTSMLVDPQRPPASFTPQGSSDGKTLDDARERSNAAGDRGGKPVAAPTTEVDDIAAALAVVLSRRPRRTASPHARSASDDDDSDTAIVAAAARRGFVSTLRHEATDIPRSPDPVADADDEPGAGAVPGERLTWLASARRRTVRRRLKAAGAWMATLAIGCAIVAIAAVILFGGAPVLDAWLDLTSRTL